MYPQERASRFPLIEYTSPKKPLRCTVVMSLVYDVMIGGGIGGRKPSLKIIPELVPCDALSADGMTVRV
jgi:hypothetical protein